MSDLLSKFLSGPQSKMLNYIINFLSIYGSIVILKKLALKYFRFYVIKKLVLRPPKDPQPQPDVQYLLDRYGAKTWVMITGSSDGIGKQLGFQFAGLGFNLILVARNKTKLELVQKEIQSKYPSVQVKIVLNDFSKVDNCSKIFDQVKDLDISILINNVGMNETGLESDHSVAQAINMVNTNMLSYIFCTKQFAKYVHQKQQSSQQKEKENNEEKKRSTAIITLSSISAVLPFGLYELYASTKRFNYYFNEQLRAQLNKLDIDSLILLPAYVQTDLSPHKTPYTISTEEFCNVVLGFLCHRRVSSYGHWKHLSLLKHAIANYRDQRNQQFILAKSVSHILVSNQQKALKEFKDENKKINNKID